LSRKLIIAIDGPAGSGKSTTARLLAKRLNYLYVDTGAMYRALTLKVLQRGIDPKDEARVAQVAQKTELTLRDQGGKVRVFLDGKDVSDLIRSQEVDGAVSFVSRVPLVRERMVELQRRIGEKGGVVMEGRDIGTVVFPEADVKVFMVASQEERAKRRWKELRRQGLSVSLEEVLQEIRKRDQIDATRQASPMKPAEDALILDTTDLTIQQQVDLIYQEVRKREKS